jgi:3D (Asp-Asp-Asp) domain-containing protein
MFTIPNGGGGQSQSALPGGPTPNIQRLIGHLVKRRQPRDDPYVSADCYTNGEGYLSASVAQAIQYESYTAFWATFSAASSSPSGGPFDVTCSCEYYGCSIDIEPVETGPPANPVVITGVSPPSWVAGSTVNFAVTGSGFGSSPTLNIQWPNPEGSSYSTTCSGSACDGEIDGTATVPPDAVGQAIATVSASYAGQGLLGGSGELGSPGYEFDVVAVPTLTLQRQCLVQVLATGSPSGGVFSVSITPFGGGSPLGLYPAGNTTQGNNTTIDTINFVDPPNPDPKMAPSPGALAQVQVTYTAFGASASKQFSVPTFGMSCYHNALETDYGASCTGTYEAYGTIWGPGYSLAPLPNLSANYCAGFLGEITVEGSGIARDGTLIQYNPPTGIYTVVTQITGATGPVIAGQTVARDPNIIPRSGTWTVQLDGGGNLLATDVGGDIKGYRLDLFNGTGTAACASFTNPILVGACSPGNSTCPGSTIQQ